MHERRNRATASPAPQQPALRPGPPRSVLPWWWPPRARCRPPSATPPSTQLHVAAAQLRTTFHPPAHYSPHGATRPPWRRQSCNLRARHGVACRLCPTPLEDPLAMALLIWYGVQALCMWGPRGAPTPCCRQPALRAPRHGRVATAGPVPRWPRACILALWHTLASPSLLSHQGAPHVLKVAPLPPPHPQTHRPHYHSSSPYISEIQGFWPGRLAYSSPVSL